jgi:hypothetical protein
MWAFVKSAPWTFGIGAAILLLSIAGVIIGVVTRGRWKDRGLLVGNGRPLKWPKESLPLPVWYAPGIAESWLDAWMTAAADLSRAAERPLFMHPIEAIPEMRLESASGIVLQDDGGLDPDRGHTELHWDQDGNLIRALITLSEAHADKRGAIMLHEAGHALGLDHDEQRDSIMYPTLQTWPKLLSQADQDLLRRIYG